MLKVDGYIRYYNDKGLDSIIGYLTVCSQSVEVN